MQNIDSKNSEPYENRTETGTSITKNETILDFIFGDVSLQ